jgi:hypothetical protein
LSEPLYSGNPLSEIDELEPRAETEGAGSALRIQQLELQAARQQEMIRWLESELESVRRSITWRGTEPVRQAYARVQALQRALEKGRSESAGASRLSKLRA